MFQAEIQQFRQHIALPPDQSLCAHESPQIACYLFPERPAMVMPQRLFEKQKSECLAIQRELCHLNFQWQKYARENTETLAQRDFVQAFVEPLSQLLQSPLSLKEVSWYRYLPGLGALPDTVLPPDWACRRLEQEDAEAVAVFKSQCPVTDQGMGQVSLEDPVAFGCLNAQAEIVGMASYWFWADHLADIGILTSPAARGKGVAAAVVRALVSWGQNQGKLSQFRHLDTNLASARVADKLGFEKAFVALFFELSVTCCPIKSGLGTL